uniref:Uncharacterized protein n=2 Tax=Canis lupus TaxID=9612 RepID=A0A8C0PQS4_CANLF
MWYPCVLTMCHISIMVTRESFYISTVILFLISPIRFNSFFLPISYIFFLFSHSLLIPLLSFSPLYLYD